MDTSLLPAASLVEEIGEVDSDEARRPHAPGVWLIYFTLASLPLFGLGQWFVPAVEEERRAWFFLYFLAYISSGMGLLLATSFLNLRRYLRQRKLKMPAAMTATWLSTGAILIVGLTVVAAVLPLPGAGLSVLRGSTRRVERPPRLAAWRCSRTAASRARGPRARDRPRRRPRAQPASAGKAKGSGQTNDPNAAQQTSGKGRPGAKRPGKFQERRPARQVRTIERRHSRARQGITRQQDQAGRSSQEPGRPLRERGRSRQGCRPETPSRTTRMLRNKTTRSHRKRIRTPSDTAKSAVAAAVAVVPGPVVVARARSSPPEALALIYGLFRYGPVLLEALRDLLASLLEVLFIEKPEKRAKDAAAELSEPASPPRPFASFANPFDTGLDQRFSPNDLVIYSFEALEAWASEHDLARSPHETPTEFVRRLGQARADLRQDATRLVGFFVTIVYGQRGFQAGSLAGAPPVLAGARERARVIKGDATRS